MKIKVLYEDANILAIDKPSGMIVHPDGKIKEDSVTDWFVENYPRAKNVGEKEGGVIRPGVVHRLDRETSGVLLLAKNKKAHELLKKQFQDRTIKKTYVAIVSGNMKNDRGVINKPIGRSPKDFRRYLAGRGARGEMRDAITQYRVLQRFEAEHCKFTYLEIHPKTGRTHQIRVHMKYLNHPVVCDSLYNPDNPCPKGLKRMALHAKSIEFKNLKGDTVKVESPIPLQFKKTVNCL